MCGEQDDELAFCLTASQVERTAVGEPFALDVEQSSRISARDLYRPVSRAGVDDDDLEVTAALSLDRFERFLDERRLVQRADEDSGGQHDLGSMEFSRRTRPGKAVEARDPSMQHAGDGAKPECIMTLIRAM